MQYSDVWVGICLGAYFNVRVNLAISRSLDQIQENIPKLKYFFSGKFISKKGSNFLGCDNICERDIFSFGSILERVALQILLKI